MHGWQVNIGDNKHCYILNTYVVGLMVLKKISVLKFPPL